MPAVFQKVMDYTSVGLDKSHCFLDDIIIVFRGSKEAHLKLVYKCLQKLDEVNLRLNLPKCHFAKTEKEWLGYKLTQSGIAPLDTKTSALLNLTAPKNQNNCDHFKDLFPTLVSSFLIVPIYVIHFDLYLKRTLISFGMMNLQLTSNIIKIK